MSLPQDRWRQTANRLALRPSRGPAGKRTVQRRVAAAAAVLLPFVLWGMTLPTFCGGGARSRRMNCRFLMREIAWGLHMYADLNDGEFPPTLYGLVETGFQSGQLTFLCPGKGGRAREFIKRVHDRARPLPSPTPSEFYTDYCYIRPSRRLTELPPDTVVLMDRAGNHKGHGNVLLAGDLVGWEGRDVQGRELAGKEWEELVAAYPGRCPVSSKAKTSGGFPWVWFGALLCLLRVPFVVRRLRVAKIRWRLRAQERGDPVSAGTRTQHDGIR